MSRVQGNENLKISVVRCRKGDYEAHQIVNNARLRAFSTAASWLVKTFKHINC